MRIQATPTIATSRADIGELFRSSLIMISKRHHSLSPLVVTIVLTFLTGPPKMLGDDISRDLGLQRMGPDIINVNPGPVDATLGQGKHGGRRKSPVANNAPSSNVLAYTSSQAVAESVRRYMFDTATKNNAAAIPISKKWFANDSLLKRFDRKFAPYGFSSQNLGDTVAGYLIVSWEIVNNTDSSRNAVGIRHVREAVRRTMEQNGKAAALSNTDKQRYSEILKYGTVVFIDNMKQLQQTHDYAGQRTFQNQVATWALNFGLDVRRTQLTDRGFVRG